MSEAELVPLNLDSDSGEALDLLVRPFWRIVGSFHGLLAAAEDEMGTVPIRAHHEATMLRVRLLIERGQGYGAFRTDRSSHWLTACFYSLLHDAVAEIRAGRLKESEATTALPATIKSLTATPAAGAPQAH